MVAQHGLDLAQLDAVTTQFDLQIAPTQKHQVAVRQSACEVAGAVQAAIRGASERVEDEGAGIQLRAVEIARGESGAAQPDFALLAGRDRLTLVVHEVHVGPRNGPANRNDRLLEIGPVQGIAGGKDGIFRGTVDIGQAASGHGSQKGTGHPDGGHVAAQQHILQPAQVGQAFADEQVEEAGRHHQGTDLQRPDHPPQVAQRHEGVLVDGKTRAHQKRSPQLQCGEVEGQVGQQEVDPGGVEGTVGLAVHQVEHARMGDRHALGKPGGP